MYVGNLSFDAGFDEIKSLFESHGGVEDVFIVKDRDSGRPRGFAFVTMDTKESMEAAINALNGEEFMGRPIVINEARPREERPQRNGGGGGGGGGGRRDFGGDRRGGGGGGGRRDFGGGRDRGNSY